jgi:nucleoside-diphosphate-sugar epimerase
VDKKVMKIYITGGAGYVGSSLVPRLLEEGHTVTVLDLMIYGEDVLDNHENLKIIKGDMRDTKLLEQSIPGHDCFVHLACISNDPSFELNPDLGKSINLDSFKPLVEISENSGIKRFINASSSSVYGVKDERDVHENMSLEPLTDYSRFKANCEDILMNYNSPSFTTTSIRPATVCGYSRRQRLDVVVNIFTNLAFHNKEITIFGGNQLRPNIHIKDMVEAYLTLINAPIEKITGNIFNAGDENKSVLELAETVKQVIGSDVNLIKSNSDDNRSYHISSEKIKNELGFATSYSIKNAAEDLKMAFENKTLLDTLSNEFYFNIKRMQNISLK